MISGSGTCVERKEAAKAELYFNMFVCRFWYLGTVYSDSSNGYARTESPMFNVRSSQVISNGTVRVLLTFATFHSIQPLLNSHLNFLSISTNSFTFVKSWIPNAVGTCLMKIVNSALSEGYCGRNSLRPSNLPNPIGSLLVDCKRIWERHRRRIGMWALFFLLWSFHYHWLL